MRVVERRVRACEEKVRLSKSVAIKIGRECDQILGPLAEVAEHCDVVLPAAARELRTLIEQLREYAEQSNNNQS